MSDGFFPQPSSWWQAGVEVVQGHFRERLGKHRYVLPRDIVDAHDGNVVIDTGKYVRTPFDEVRAAHEQVTYMGGKVTSISQTTVPRYNQTSHDVTMTQYFRNGDGVNVGVHKAHPDDSYVSVKVGDSPDWKRFTIGSVELTSLLFSPVNSGHQTAPPVPLPVVHVLAAGDNDLRRSMGYGALYDEVARRDRWAGRLGFVLNLDHG